LELELTIPIFITIVEQPPLVLSPQEHDGLMAKVYEAEAQDWCSRMLPRHLEQSAHDRYGYQTRKPGWITQKIKDLGRGVGVGVQDLVHTGAMMRQLLGFQEIRTDPRKAVARLFGPKYFWQYNKQVGAPDKAREVLTVRPDETDALGVVAQQTYDREWFHLAIPAKTTTLGSTI